jgi:hypothetical protein
MQSWLDVRIWVLAFGWRFLTEGFTLLKQV